MLHFPFSGTAVGKKSERAFSLASENVKCDMKCLTNFIRVCVYVLSFTKCENSMWKKRILVALSLSLSHFVDLSDLIECWDQMHYCIQHTTIYRTIYL